MTAISELGASRRWGVLAICCMSLLIVGLDNTIVNVALPDIGRELAAPVSGLAWVVDAYTIALASLLMMSGSLADRFGRRRVFQLGLVLFGLGSLLCGLAPNAGLLVVFRVVQALGGSMLNPVAVSIIATVFPDPRERARAMGFWSAVFGLSMALGPVVGGLLVALAGWRAIFWVNIPVIVAAIVLTALFVPESRAARSRRLDVPGQLLVVAVFGSLTFGIIEGPAAGWTSPAVLAAFGLATAALLGLLLVEPRRRDPLIDPRFFRSIPFSGATVIAICGFACLGLFLFLNTLYLQEGLGFSPLTAGLLTLPMAVMTIVVSPFSGRVVGARGPRIPLVTAGIFIMACGALLTQVPATPVYGLLIPAYLAFGIGIGVLNPPITNAAVSGMPGAQAGVAGAVASTSRQLGVTVGVAVAGAIAGGGAGAGALVPAELVAHSHAGWWVMLGCGAAILLLAFVVTGRRARASAETVRAELIAEPAS